MKYLIFLLFFLIAVSGCAQPAYKWVQMERAYFTETDCDRYFAFCFIKDSTNHYDILRNKKHWIWVHAEYNQKRNVCSYKSDFTKVKKKLLAEKSTPETLVNISQIDNNILYLDYFCKKIGK